MEATVVFWGYIGIVENTIETTIILWYIPVVEANCQFGSAWLVLKI